MTQQQQRNTNIKSDEVAVWYFRRLEQLVQERGVSLLTLRDKTGLTLAALNNYFAPNSDFFPGIKGWNSICSLLGIPQAKFHPNRLLVPGLYGIPADTPPLSDNQQLAFPVSHADMAEALELLHKAISILTKIEGTNNE